MIGEDIPRPLKDRLYLIMVVAYELCTRHRVVTLIDDALDLLIVPTLRRLLKERILELRERYIQSSQDEGTRKGVFTAS